MSGIYAIVILVLVLALAISNADANIEGDALSSWKRALRDPFNVLQSWDQTLNENPCFWFHVTCSSGGSVVRVDVGTAGLSGPIVPELGMLANLLSLEAFGNNLTGTIPVELGNLTRLVSLDLYNNTLSGAIPSALGNLARLRFLRLNNNKLSGALPESIIELITNGQLQILDVSQNHLAGTIQANNQTGFVVTTITQDLRALNA